MPVIEESKHESPVKESIFVKPNDTETGDLNPEQSSSSADEEEDEDEKVESKQPGASKTDNESVYQKLLNNDASAKTETDDMIEEDPETPAKPKSPDKEKKLEIMKKV